MNEKDSQPKEPKAAKQSRRIFLKTGAATAVLHCWEQR
jgi:hypothetical protein